MKNPWKTLSSKIAYKHPFWYVNKDKVIQPDGNEGFYYTVITKSFAMVIGLKNDNETLYMVEQWRYPMKQKSLEFSTGGVENGETPEQGAVREFEEEAGLKAGKIEVIGSFYPSGGLTNQNGHVFLATQLSEGIQQLEAGEKDMVVKEVKIKDLDKMIETGEIKDGPTIVAYHFLQNYLKKL